MMAVDKSVRISPNIGLCGNAVDHNCEMPSRLNDQGYSIVTCGYVRGKSKVGGLDMKHELAISTLYKLALKKRT